MSARKAAITQAEIKRCLSAARDAGIPVAKVEISRQGTVVIHSAMAPVEDTPNPWDKQ